jgi:hypothetical protein
VWCEVSGFIGVVWHEEHVKLEGEMETAPCGKADDLTWPTGRGRASRRVLVRHYWAAEAVG